MAAAGSRTHEYDVAVVWTGDRGSGTSGYAAYGRDHEVRATAGTPGSGAAGSGAPGSGTPEVGAPPIPGSADPAFRGDRTRWNPEQLLVASLSQCHMLWYLHLASAAGVVVVGYEDRAHGVMVEDADGAGRFEGVTLRPRVTIAAGGDADRARSLHADAHAMCFVARSVNFPVAHEPTVEVV